MLVTGFLFLFLFLTFTVFVCLLLRGNSGFRGKILILFTLLMYFIYFFISPLFYFVSSDFYIFGNDIKEYYNEGVIIYNLAVLSLMVGYYALPLKTNIQSPAFIDNFKNQNTQRLGWFIYAIAITSTLLWAHQSGYGVARLFFLNYMMEVEQDAGFNSKSPYLLALGEMIITGVLFLYISNVRRLYFIISIILALMIFLSFGFRYRIIVLFISLICFFMLTHKIKHKYVLYLFFISSFLLYTQVILSHSRNTLRVAATGQGQIELRQNKGVIETVAHQTSNHRTFFSTLKSFDSGQAEHDYGESMILHIFYRVIPSSFFPQNKKPGIPAQKIIKSSFNSKEGYKSGSALTNVGEYYIAFGTTGVVIFMFIFGSGIKMLERSYHKYKNNILFLAFYCVTTGSVFHFISRGYLPQFVNSYAFIILPFLINYKFVFRKEHIKNKND